jgi:hypothetical protein
MTNADVIGAIAGSAGAIGLVYLNDALRDPAMLHWAFPLTMLTWIFGIIAILCLRYGKD